MLYDILYGETSQSRSSSTKDILPIQSRKVNLIMSLGMLAALVLHISLLWFIDLVIIIIFIVIISYDSSSYSSSTSDFPFVSLNDKICQFWKVGACIQDTSFSLSKWWNSSRSDFPPNPSSSYSSSSIDYLSLFFLLIFIFHFDFPILKGWSSSWPDFPPDTSWNNQCSHSYHRLSYQSTG